MRINDFQKFDSLLNDFEFKLALCKEAKWCGFSSGRTPGSLTAVCRESTRMCVICGVFCMPKERDPFGAL
jgi:hypothetical protein